MIRYRDFSRLIIMYILHMLAVRIFEIPTILFYQTLKFDKSHLITSILLYVSCAFLSRINFCPSVARMRESFYNKMRPSLGQKI